MSPRRGRHARGPDDGPGAFLKWAGNKAFLWAKHPHLVPCPSPEGRWVEPFCGSAGLFYTLPAARRQRALLTDINPRIVGVHKAVLLHTEDVIHLLEWIQYERHAAEDQGPEAVSEHYYSLRYAFNRPGMDPASARGAALFIAINRLCVNGLFRENQQGEFNVAIGAYTRPVLCDPEQLRACAAALQHADIYQADCEDVMAQLRAGDACLLDVPYARTSKTASFTAYSAGGGDWGTTTSQLGLTGIDAPPKRQRFADLLVDLDARGVRFTLTDAWTPETRSLYSRWRIDSIAVPRSISRDADGRGAVTELVATNWQ